MRLGDNDRSQMPLETGPYGVASSWGSGQGPASSTSRAAHGTQTSWGGPQSIAQRDKSSLKGKSPAEGAGPLSVHTARWQPEQGAGQPRCRPAGSRQEPAERAGPGGLRSKTDSAWMWGAFCPSGSGVLRAGSPDQRHRHPRGTSRDATPGLHPDLLDLNPTGAGPAKCEDHCGSSARGRGSCVCGAPTIRVHRGDGTQRKGSKSP